MDMKNQNTRASPRLSSGDLSILAAIRSTRSISRAADQLGMSQPTVSKKLARMEELTRQIFFHRSHAGLTPTPVVDAVLDHFEMVHGQLARIDHLLDQLAELEGGDVTIGVGPIVEQLLLPAVLQSLLVRTRANRVSVVTEEAATLVRGLREVDLDIIVGPFDTDDPQFGDLAAKHLATERIVAVAATGHPELQNPDANLQSWQRYPLVAPRMQGSISNQGGIGDGWRWLSCNNYAVIKPMINRGEAVSAGPKSIFRREIESGALVVLDILPSLHWRSACLVRPETKHVPLVAFIIEEFVRVARSYALLAK